MAKKQLSPEEKILEQANLVLTSRQQDSAEAMSSTLAFRQEVTVRDVPLDKDLAELFSEASHSEFQQMVLLLQLNRRLARMELAAKPLEAQLETKGDE